MQKYTKQGKTEILCNTQYLEQERKETIVSLSVRNLQQADDQRACSPLEQIEMQMIWFL